jgi:hypothetical protein
MPYAQHNVPKQVNLPKSGLFSKGHDYLGFTGIPSHSGADRKNFTFRSWPGYQFWDENRGMLSPQRKPIKITKEAIMDDVKIADMRGEIKDDPESLYLMDHPDSTEEIPVLDFGPYLQGVRGGLEAVAADLREISTTVGFFYLTGHGIPQNVIDRIFAESRRFHSLPRGWFSRTERAAAGEKSEYLA